ncbi:galactose mutarotase [Lactovum odontotermitis]
MTTEISINELPLASGSIHEITLSNGRLTIVAHDFGARLHRLFAPDKNGQFENILLSKDNPTSYLNDKGYYGVICGPVAGRIAGAKFDSVKLEANENNNLLHSGSHGWERQFWSFETFEDKSKENVGVKFSLTDESSGFPGPIQAHVTYTLQSNHLEVKMSAQTEKDTLFNPAWHPYFNLSADKESTLRHILKVPADKVVETDDENIPTGRLLNVSGTAYDLRRPTSIGQVQEKLPSGFDDCFILPADLSGKILSLSDPFSGRKLECQSDRQAVVIYTAANPELDSTIAGSKMTPNRGVAIEFQEIPDEVHHPEWGSIALKAGEKKTFITSYTLSAEE